jgi:endonuclease/exonuclease/phosphatase (EEP) superfamily protein YafD
MVARARFGLGVLLCCYLTVLSAVFWMVGSGQASFGWPALLRELLLYLFVPLPFLFVAGLVLRARMVIAWSLLPIVPFLYFYGPQFSPRPTVEADGARIRVFSFNVGAARGFGQMGPVLDAVIRADADVVVLVEAREGSLNSLGAALLGSYPYQAGSRSVYLFSRLPLADARTGILRSGAHDSLLAEVQLDGRLIDVAAVHLLRTEAYGGIGSGVSSLLRTGRLYQTAERDAAATELSIGLRRLGRPVVLAGDFNMTASSRSYDLITARFEDSFREAGWGFGHTYPTTLSALGVSLPLLRIDYIFHSPELVALHAAVGSSGGSDHLPLVTDLALR